MASKCKFFYGGQALSPKGKANFVYINTRVNVIQGEEKGYGITLEFPKKETKELQDSFLKLFEEKKQTEECKELVWQGDPYPGYSEDADGNPVFKLKSNRQDKNGKWEKIPLVDSKNNPLPLDTNIGSGSIVRAIYTPAVYWVNKKNFGVTLFLDKLQVLDLKTFSSGVNRSTVEFPEEDGYVASVDFPVSEEEDPF